MVLHNDYKITCSKYSWNVHLIRPEGACHQIITSCAFPGICRCTFPDEMLLVWSHRKNRTYLCTAQRIHVHFSFPLGYCRVSFHLYLEVWQLGVWTLDSVSGVGQWKRWDSIDQVVQHHWLPPLQTWKGRHTPKWRGTAELCNACCRFALNSWTRKAKYDNALCYDWLNDKDTDTTSAVL